MTVAAPFIPEFFTVTDPITGSEIRVGRVPEDGDLLVGWMLSRTREGKEIGSEPQHDDAEMRDLLKREWVERQGKSAYSRTDAGRLDYLVFLPAGNCLAMPAACRIPGVGSELTLYEPCDIEEFTNWCGSMLGIREKADSESVDLDAAMLALSWRLPHAPNAENTAMRQILARAVHAVAGFCAAVRDRQVVWRALPQQHSGLEFEATPVLSFYLRLGVLLPPASEKHEVTR